MVNPLSLGSPPKSPLLREWNHPKDKNIPVATFLGNLGSLAEQIRYQKATIVQQAQEHAYLVVSRFSSSSACEDEKSTGVELELSKSIVDEQEDVYEFNSCWGKGRKSTKYSASDPKTHSWGKRGNRSAMKEEDMDECVPLVAPAFVEGPNPEECDKDVYYDYSPSSSLPSSDCSFRPPPNEIPSMCHSQYHGRYKYRKQRPIKDDSFHNQSRGNHIARKFLKRLLRRKQSKKDGDYTKNKIVECDHSNDWVIVENERELPHRIGNRTFKRKDTKNMYFSNQNTIYNESLVKNDTPQSSVRSHFEISSSDTERSKKSSRDVNRRDRKWLYNRKRRSRRNRIFSEPTKNQLGMKVSTAFDCRSQKQHSHPDSHSVNAPISQNMSRYDHSSIIPPVTAIATRITQQRAQTVDDELSVEASRRNDTPSHLNPLNHTSSVSTDMDEQKKKVRHNKSKRCITDIQRQSKPLQGCLVTNKKSGTTLLSVDVVPNPKRLDWHRSSFDQVDYDDILESAKTVLSNGSHHNQQALDMTASLGDKDKTDNTTNTANTANDTSEHSTQQSSESYAAPSSTTKDVVLDITVKDRVQEIEHRTTAFDDDSDVVGHVEQRCLRRFSSISSYSSNTNTSITTARPPQCIFDLFPKLPLKQNGRPPLAPSSQPLRQLSIGDSASLTSFDSNTEAEALNCKLKVVIFGSGSHNLSDSIQQIFTRKSGKRQMKTRGVNLSVDIWNPTYSEKNCSSFSSNSCRVDGNGDDLSFSLWEMQGLAKDHHYASQSLCISPDSLYVIVYKIPPILKDTDLSLYENDRFALEDAEEELDRAIHRDMDEHFFSWVDLLFKHSPRGCAILPVVSCDQIERESRDGLERIDSICNLLRQRIIADWSDYVEAELDDLAWDSNGSGSPSLSPKIVFHKNKIPRVFRSSDNGSVELRDAILDLRSCGTVFRSHMNKELTPITSYVRKMLSSYRKDGHDVLHLNEISDRIEKDFAGTTDDEVTDALKFLSSVGDILYFAQDETDGTQHSSTLSTKAILSKFVILDPKWMIDVVSCILRDDWKAIRSKVYNMRHRLKNDCNGLRDCIERVDSSCPVLSAQDTISIWKSRKMIANTNRMISKHCSDDIFLFLRKVCEYYGIFITVFKDTTSSSSTSTESSSMHYLIPGLCLEYPDNHFWSYKSKQKWKTTLCQSWLFKKRQPSTMFDQVRIAVLDELNDIVATQMNSDRVNVTETKVKELRCWKTAFYAKVEEAGSTGKFVVEFFIRLVHRDSLHCPASYTLEKGTKLVVSARGAEGRNGEIIWKLGYGNVLDSIESVLNKVCREDLEREVVCPQCLANSDPRRANVWMVDNCSVYDQMERMSCDAGHIISANMIYGSVEDESDATTVCTVCTTNTACTSTSSITPDYSLREDLPGKSIKDVLGGVVLVALMDTKNERIICAGTGFIADNRNGLILTAGHIFYKLEEGKEIGPRYKGCRDAEAIIGTMIKSGDGLNCGTVHFTYSAEIVYDVISSVDAVVLRITKKFKKPFQCHSMDLKLQSNTPIMHGKCKYEKLEKLELNDAHYEEQIRIVGFVQSGEGRYEPGKKINHTVCIAKGYVCSNINSSNPPRLVRGKFEPNSEIVVECTAYEGQSGGPCVNQDGKVIGIVSRTHPGDSKRCYLVPWTELKHILKKAKKRIGSRTNTSSEVFL